MKTIGIIAALPEEAGQILKHYPKRKHSKLQGFDLFQFSTDIYHVSLIIGGMGPKNAYHCAKAIIEAENPEAILNIGFCGAITENLIIGDIVLGARVFNYSNGVFNEVSISNKFGKSFSEKHIQAYSGAFISSSEILHKQEALKIIPKEILTPVLEMETAAVAEVCEKFNIPLIAIRSVSDQATEEIDFKISDITDENYKIKFSKIILALVRKPSLLIQFIRLAKNSKKAATTLKDVVIKIIEQT
jgi:adenosylhomocysteine nucleosidase